MSTDLPMLFKDKQQWSVSVVDQGTQSTIYVTHGQVGGKLQEKVTVITEGKNKGRANETTHYEQALAEAKSKWNKQKDKLYLEKGETSKSFDVRPMLAQSYDKHGHKIKYPCYVQPKLDGLRCLATKDGLYSRQGKPFKAMAHIADALIIVFSRYPDLILDGELYSHEIDFQSIISGTKRDESNELTSKIEYHVYDCIESNKSYKDRLSLLDNVIDVDTKVIKLVQTEYISQEDDVPYWHDKFVEDGYEGIMLRNAAGVYTPDKRSYDLQKVKSFKDDEFKIVAVRPDKNQQAVFTCVTQDGTEFDVKPQGDDELRKSYLTQDLVGKMLTVKFFDYTTSANPVPRFPVGIAPRTYE